MLVSQRATSALGERNFIICPGGISQGGDVVQPMDQTSMADAGGERQHRLADRLREVREYLGISQQFVADHTGIPRVAISAIENGKRKVDALELEALSALYKYPITYFLGTDLEEPPTVRALAREAKTLTERDREQVLQFAQFLKVYDQAQRRGTGKAPQG
jgi:transcriptional regulator with XRE-family HTH domain